MADRTGQRLGNYRLTQLLGRGGFAEVYLGEHVRLGTHAAVKVLYTRLASSEEVESFEKEARTIAHLRHPHIVRVFDFDVVDDTPFLVMDYAPNGTLRKLHPRGTKLPLPLILTYVKQIADALQHAHDQRLIHRDIKPENMLLGQDNELLLSDFGIATIAQSSRYQGTQDMAGTISYMAPEQVQGKPRPASDQYALGIVVYEWLSGERPFHGSFTEIATQHVLTPPPSLREKVPTLTPEVEQVVMTALAKDPKARFGSVRAFANALEQAYQVEQVRSSAPTILALPTKPSTMQSTPEVAPSNLPPTQLASPDKDGKRPVPVTSTSDNVAEFAASHLPYTYRGHSHTVYALAWSPDSTRIASGSRDKTVQVWNAADGSKVYSYRGHSGTVYGLAWSPNGTRIASGSGDNTVHVWNAADGSKVYSYRSHSNVVRAVAWSLDGKRIASGSWDKTVQVWNAADGSKVYIYNGHSYLVLAVAWSPDGTRIASGSGDKTVQVWNAADGSHVYTYRGHSDVVRAVAWSPDSTRIASGSWDKTVQVWNVADGSHVYTYRGHSSPVFAMAWSPDGTRIASGSRDKTVQVWNAADGSKIYTYRGHSDAVEAVVWSPDGSRIASASADKTVQVWQPG
jgi:WD40 repeat protein